MSDLLIKGMKMPTECLECPIKNCDKAWDFGYTRPEDCPLVELPPHGRLVDADKFDLSFITFTRMKDGKEFETYNAPIVLEASNG